MERAPQPIEPHEKVESHSKFEDAFAHKNTFIINGAKVESVRIYPENLEHPESEVPVLVAPGFAATMDTYKRGMEILVDEGREVISLNHPRRGGFIPKSGNEDVDENPSEELRKAHTILGLLEQEGVEQVDAIAHSEAAINVCIAAMLHPEKFRNIVLYAPAGLIGNDSLYRLMRGVMSHPKRPKSIDKFPVTEDETEYLKQTKGIDSKYQMANPLRAAKEILAISKAQIQEMLQYLHEKGIKIVVIAAVDDTFFPIGDMLKNNKGMGDENAGFLDGFLSVAGGHMQLQIHPEKYMWAAENMLETMEAQRALEIPKTNKDILDS